MARWQLGAGILIAGLSGALSAGPPEVRPEPPKGLCIEAGANGCPQAPSTPPGQARIKWHPGHYLRVSTDEVLSSAELDILRTVPAVQGIEMDYFWRTLEPERGNYDFALIEQHLAALRPLHKRLIIRVLDRSFGSAPGLHELLPDYLASEPGGLGGWFDKGEAGVVARVWLPAIADRKIALLQALAQRFDKDPYVEGVLANNESSPGSGVKPGTPADYNKASQASQLKRIAEAAVEGWPHTMVVSRLNHLGDDQMGSLVQYHYQHGVAWGGPDVAPAPHNDTLASRIIRAIEPGYSVNLCGTVPSSFVAASTPYTGGKDGSFTAQQFFDHAKNKLHVTHLSWVRREAGTAPWTAGILPVIQANPTFNSECPVQYHNRCDTSN